MKIRIRELASSISSLGLGVLASMLADKWGWGVGFTLISLGIIGLAIVVFWDKLKYVVNPKYRILKKMPSGTIISKTGEIIGNGKGPITGINKKVEKL